MYETVADTLGLPVETVRRAVWWAEYKAAALRRNDGRFIARMEKRLERRVRAALEQQRDYLIGALAGLSVFRAKGVHRVERKALDDELRRMTDGMPGREELASALQSSASIVMLKGGRSSVKKYRLGRFGISFDLTNLRAVEYLEALKVLHLSDRQGSIDKTTKDRIVEVVTEGVRDGKTYTEMAKDIEDLGDEGVFSRARAQGIAVHESAKAYEFGNREPMREAQERTGDKVFKRWVTVGDDKVTPECQSNEAQEWIPLEVQFNSGHDTPPRFPNVHCRCATAYEFESVLRASA